MKRQNLLKSTLLLLLSVVCNAAWATDTLAIFSESTDATDLIPVRISNYAKASQGYAIKMNTTDDYTGKAVNSGDGSYEANEIWYLVGDASSFTMHSHTAGTALAVTLSGTGEGSAATLSTTGTELCLTACEDGSYAISPKTNTAQSFNMYGAAGRDIKLYASSADNSRWVIKRIDMGRALTLNYNAQLEGGYEQNYKIGQLAITIDGATSASMLTKESVQQSASRTCYLPEGAQFSIAAGQLCHGWTMDINGTPGIATQSLPEGGLTATVNIAVDPDNRYQYLYYSPSDEGHPYRIPAITTTANGYVFAINDYRPCGNDIGYGEVDLVMRHSTAAGSEWDGHSWSEPIKIADGLGNAAPETWQVGFGDPAIVADRESNEILVMSVCGNRVCWYGNYGAGTPDNPENPNRIARLRIKYNDKTRQWEVGQPKEVTYDIYPLFKDSEGNVHASSMFIGAGRIAQSSRIKVGTHYRLYCSVWTVTMTQRQHHNYVLYSDDFGESWHLLGKLGYENSPAPRGNEPKCEELPDGSVLLSSRKGYGRYFNVFRYTDVAQGQGEWMGVVSTDQAGDLKWGSNDTNGEPLRIGNVLFLSAPTGYSNPANESRSDVSVFYKLLSNDASSYNPTDLSNGWTKLQVSTRNSAYSSMTILPDGNLGLFYEEGPGYYSMVYVPIILKDVLPADVYEATKTQPASTLKKAKRRWKAKQK